MNKFIGCFLSAVIIMLSAGCAQEKPANNEKKIVIWHWMNDRKFAFDKLAQQYKKETGITVEFKLFFPPDIYSQKVIAAARAGKLPEIFGILGEKKTLGSFIKAGHVADLTSYMNADNNKWKNSFYPQTLAVPSFGKNNFYQVPEGIYGAPIDTTVIEFLYNKSLFKTAGLDPNNPPKSFDEFIDMAKKIKATSPDADGFICGWAEGWLMNTLAMEWAINLLGEKKFFDTIEGKVPYTDPQWIEVFSYFSKLRDSGVMVSNITSVINKEAEYAFSQGKAGFSLNGSWSINVYQQLNNGLDFGFFPLPKIAANNPAKIIGGAGSSLLVSDKSPNKELAVKFLQWITDKPQQEFLIKETNNLPAIKGCDDSLSPLLKNLSQDLNSLTHDYVWPKTEDSRVIELIIKGLQQIIMGIKTPQEVAKDIQEVKQRVLAQ